MNAQVSPSKLSLSDDDRQRLEDVGYLTCMTLVLMGNYAQTGHFGGPLAYTPFNVAYHLAGPENGGLRYDYRRPKHPFSDKFMMAAGHCANGMYALYVKARDAAGNEDARPAIRVFTVNNAPRIVVA